MVARLDYGAILTKCGRYDRDELVEYCLVLLKSAQNSKSGRAARSLQTGPAIKAKKAAKKFKKTGMWPADPYEKASGSPNPAMARGADLPILASRPATPS